MYADIFCCLFIIILALNDPYQASGNGTILHGHRLVLLINDIDEVYIYGY